MREYWACLNNPHWRAVLKAWVKVGIERGVDGLHHQLLLPPQLPVRALPGGLPRLPRRALHGGGAEEQVRRSRDLKKHKFTEIGGWHDPKESTPLRREALRFSQIACKEAFDEVFVKHGRSLKPDLILAQWNHLGDFNQISGDERCLLPEDLWGGTRTTSGTAPAAAAHFTDLEAGILGEGTLQARYIRGAFDNKPFTLGKYESTRTRVAIAELAANGGAPMGFYTRFKDPVARKEIVRYYHFLEKHADLYRGQPLSCGGGAALPAHAASIEGDVGAVEAFKKIGQGAARPACPVRRAAR